MPVSYEIRGRTAVVALDHPPVNGLGAELRRHLLAALDRANADNDANAIVVTGTAKVFSGGADVKEFGTPAAGREPRLPVLISALENSPKPTVAAIAGICMGGGLELAVGAHYRVAHADARIGMPEVKLGLLPGAGGTQRLPRTIGLESALNLIVSGESVRAAALAGTKLFDEVTEGDVVQTAIGLADKIVSGGLPLKRRRDATVADALAEPFLQFARSHVAAASNSNPARLKCVEAVAWSVSKPFDEALRFEREAFVLLIATLESRALRRRAGSSR